MIKIKYKFIILAICLLFSGNLFSQSISIDRAFDFLNKSRYNDAIKMFTDLIKRNDTISNFYYGRGIAYLYTKQYNTAMTDFEKTIELSANFADAYYGLAIANIMLDSHIAAKTILNKAIKLDSNYYELYYVRGILNYVIKDYKNAITDFNYVIEKKNNLNSNALYGRAITYYKLERLLDASSDIDTFLQNNKTNNNNELVKECHKLLNVIIKNNN